MACLSMLEHRAFEIVVAFLWRTLIISCFRYGVRLREWHPPSDDRMMNVGFAIQASEDSIRQENVQLQGPLQNVEDLE